MKPDKKLIWNVCLRSLGFACLAALALLAAILFATPIHADLELLAQILVLVFAAFFLIPFAVLFGQSIKESPDGFVHKVFGASYSFSSGEVNDIWTGFWMKTCPYLVITLRSGHRIILCCFDNQRLSDFIAAKSHDDAPTGVNPPRGRTRGVNDAGS